MLILAKIKGWKLLQAQVFQ